MIAAENNIYHLFVFIAAENNIYHLFDKGFHLF